MSTAEAEIRADYWTAGLRGWLASAARDAGFAVVGVAPADDTDAAATARDAQRFSHWIDAGHAGEMNYLKRRDESGALLRSSVRTAFPWARSVIVCAFNYNVDSPRSIDPAPANAGWIARYAWSGRRTEVGAILPTDYHDDLLARLRRVESALLERTSCTARCYVDTGPLVERSLAAESGIGWIGKNTCVINQQLGSWLLLGVILTSLPLESSDDAESRTQLQSAASLLGFPATDRCGTCTRCIDACPTGALLGSRAPTAPREMDASRCIAYLTIEKKGNIPENLREPIGRNVFGCDICQEVCPWNIKAATPSTAETRPPLQTGGMQPRAELINPALDVLGTIDSREFRRLFRGSPLQRTNRKRLLRNVAIAMGNTGDARFLPQLEQLASASEGDQANDIALRLSAHWARDRILSNSAPAQGDSQHRDEPV